MKRIREIRQRAVSRDGASFLVALMFVMVAGMVAAVVISSAAVNAERVKPTKADDQAYLAVVSALYSADDLLDKYVCSSSTGLTVNVGPDGEVTGTMKSDDAVGLAQWVIDEQKKLHGSQGKSDKRKFIKVEAQSERGAETPAALLIFTMTNSGISASACMDVWGDSETVPDDADERAKKLVEKADYANELVMKQVAVQQGDTVITWDLKGEGA